MKARIVVLWSIVLLGAMAVPAHADSMFLNFQYLKNLEPVANFYNGGTGGFGSYAGAGKNFGVTFSSNALGLRSYLNGGSGNFAATPLGTPALFFNSGTSGYINVASGFTTGTNFFYSSLAPATITIWSGANGTGTILATITVGVNGGAAAGCVGPNLYCNWTDVSVGFSGTGSSISFNAPAGYLGISDITIGSTRTAIPEPGTLLLLGSGLVTTISSRKIFLKLRRTL